MFERHVCDVQKRHCHFIGISMTSLTAFPSINRTVKSSNDPSTLSSLQNKDKHTLGCYQPAQSCLVTFLHRVPRKEGQASSEVTPSLHSRVRLGDPGFSTLLRARCISLPRHQWKVLASAAVFISGSHYGETQAFISLGKEAEDTGCQGREVTLRGDSSWLQMANTQLRPASCCTSISRESKAGAELGAWGPAVILR